MSHIDEAYQQLLSENAKLIRARCLPEDGATVDTLFRRIYAWTSDTDGIAAYQALALLVEKYRKQAS